MSTQGQIVTRQEQDGWVVGLRVGTLAETYTAEQQMRRDLQLAADLRRARQNLHECAPTRAFSLYERLAILRMLDTLLADQRDDQPGYELLNEPRRG